MTLYVDIEKKCGDFSLKVKFEAGREVFAILGASGCGKSLTLKCIAGIEKPDRGVIRLGDKVFFDSEKKINLPPRKRKVGYLFQDYALFPNMTVFQNILCGAGDREKTQEYIRRFCLEGKEKLYPSQLSGGQKQRTAMARMLAAQPDILMLDEPFSALDNYLKTKLEREVLKVLEHFEGTALFVSHDRDEVYRLTHRIAVMEEGKIVENKPRTRLFEKPETLAAALLTGCKNITRVERDEQGRLTALDWGIRLKDPGQAACEPVDPRYAGFRAHYFERVDHMEDSNVLECNVLQVIENTFSMIVLFCQKGMEGREEAVLTWELSKEQWRQIEKDRIFLKIPQEKLIFLDH